MLTCRGKCLLAAALLALLPLPAVRADSITTGVANWQITSVDALGSFSPGSVPGAVATPGAAVSIGNGSPYWGSTSAIQALDSNAQWISAATSGATDGVWGWYTYSLTLNPSPAGEYQISGTYSSDNMVDSFLINGTQMITSSPTASPSDIYGFNYVYNVLGTTPSPITLTVRVYNESTSTPPTNSPEYNPNVNYPSGVSDPNGDSNPTGFILAGDITYVGPAASVPLPASVWSGAALCGILGGLSLIKRRRTLA